MGDEFRFRMADGCNNNVMLPHVGRSGAYYARSVTPKHVPTIMRPDPSQLFDTLLARRGPLKPHPNKISSMLFALATIIIHDVFRTDDRDQNIVGVSSYLDLEPLYGANIDVQATVRTFEEGKLKPDAFAETRFFSQPPETSALLVCFNRFHNYIADQLATINEAGRFSLPSEDLDSDDEAYARVLSKRDNDLFQTSRLVTCGLYVHIVLGDYVRTILNLNRTGSTWSLDPTQEYDHLFGPSDLDKGRGNQVSVEFNLLYRWHGPISARNESWLQEHFSRLFPEQNLPDIPPAIFLARMRAWAAKLPSNPGERTFGDLQRNADGKFRDADLVKILTEATEDVAGSFGARNVPVALKAIEVLGIEQCRKWGVATLNEVREAFGMLPHATFADINSDPDIAATLEAIYGDVDNVETYPGVIVEEAKKPMTPGSGLCAGFTITRAILSDAVALIRGDRFYTVDYSPSSLTSLGFKEVKKDDAVAGGGLMYKLLMCAFPGTYTSNSVYALFPFTVPSENLLIQRSLDREKDYDYSPPHALPVPILIKTWDGVHSVLANPASYNVPWGTNLTQLSPVQFMLGGDNVNAAVQRRAIDKAVYDPPKTLEAFCSFFEATTANLLRSRSKQLGVGYEVDFVHDIAQMVHTQFTARLFHIPMKNNNPKAAFDDRQLYNMLESMFAYVFLDVEPATGFAQRAAATSAADTLTKIVKEVCNMVKKPHFGWLVHLIVQGDTEKLLPEHGSKLIKRLIDSAGSVNKVVAIILGMAPDLAVPAAQGTAEAVNLFLTEPYSKHWPDIQRLSKKHDHLAFGKLRRYAMEALRLTSPAGGLLRNAAMEGSIVDGSATHTVRKGDVVLMDLASASRDPSKFPDPNEVKLDRPDDTYIHFGTDSHSCMGNHMSVIALASILRVLGRLKGFRRAPGLRGQIVKREVHGSLKPYLKADGSAWTSFPDTMKVHFDSMGDCPWGLQ